MRVRPHGYAVTVRRANAPDLSRLLRRPQRDELVAAVADPVWQKTGIRLEFDEHTTLEHGYGVAIFQTTTGRYRSIRQLYGVMRPSPDSVHRLPKEVPVFVRNAREADALIKTGAVETGRVVHFDLPDYEQLSLI